MAARYAPYPSGGHTGPPVPYGGSSTGPSGYGGAGRGSPPLPHPDQRVQTAEQAAIQSYQDAMLAAQYWAQQLNPSVLAQLQQGGAGFAGRPAGGPAGSPIMAPAGGKGGKSCRFWGPGTPNDCKRGNACPFRHEGGPQAPPLALTVPAGKGGGEQSRFCRFFGPGTSNDCRRGDACPFIHSTGDSGGKGPCRFWGPGTPNDCRRGDACPYSHDSSGPAAGDVYGYSTRPPAPPTAQKPRCRFWPGDCRRGDACPFVHDDGAPPPSGPEGKRCRFYGPGTPNDCRRGSDCPFVHSDSPPGQ
eukprot:TRINITY_DN1900_c0_g1_i1.p1 TRINITY_DN1900_c0_g1~~TRINITY_DN1900_c0_g1_i1.p1  ORF type:complete len:301 (+),score=32.56 TRINITY_DN1900_c0_g1_i1:97-999(+)